MNFTFPLSHESTDEMSPELLEFPSMQASSSIKETILIAKDNDLVLYAVKNILIKLGYEVTTVTEGKTALEALKKPEFCLGIARYRST